ncbi:hypothetical protein GCM10029978_110550 [Actinoallomurus acanthiterrae]
MARPPAQHGTYRFHRDLLSRPYESSCVIYKTPDAMLSCVEDYRSGLPGLQEHIWSATLGPETQIFVTHPPTRPCTPRPGRAPGQATASCPAPASTATPCSRSTGYPPTT